MIAISYRREDSTPIAGRLYDRLQNEFGKKNVLMDFDSIPYGVDFRDQIKQMIDRSDLVVAIIGPEWFGQRKRKSRRIDDPADFVRLEITYALRRGVPIIPVLINDTLMPKAADLPPDIEGLAFRNAINLDTGIDFHHHADRLIGGIRALLNRAGVATTTTVPLANAPETPAPDKSPVIFPRQTKLIAGMAGLLLVVAIVVWMISNFAGRGAKKESGQLFPLQLVGQSSKPQPSAAATIVPQPTPSLTAAAVVPTIPAATPSATETTPQVHPAVTPVVSTWPSSRNGRNAQAWIGEFVNQFVQSSGGSDVDLATSFYAPSVDLFDEGWKGPDAIRHEIVSYNERWPVRYDKIHGDVQVRERIRDRQYDASFQQDYYVENAARGEWIKGAVLVDVKIEIIGGVPKISSIKQKVLNREKGAGSPAATNPPIALPPGNALGPQKIVRFTNTRFGFSALVPTEVFPNPPQTSDLERNLFSSADGRTTLILFAQRTGGRSLSAIYGEWSAQHTTGQPNKIVHYKVMKGNWFVVSGVEGERGYYLKGVQKGPVVVFMSLQYDENSSPLQDETLSAMSHAFDGN